MRFDLSVSEKHVCYGRAVLSFTDPLETVIVARSDVSRVEVKKKSPWLFRSLGAVLLLATTIGVVGFLVGDTDEFPLKVLSGYLLGGACFLGSSNRWQLTFFDGNKSHKVVQPVCSHAGLRDAMAAIQEAGRLLARNGGAAVTTK